MLWDPQYWKDPYTAQRAKLPQHPCLLTRVITSLVLFSNAWRAQHKIHGASCLCSNATSSEITFGGCHVYEPSEATEGPPLSSVNPRSIYLAETDVRTISGQVVQICLRNC